MRFLLQITLPLVLFAQPFAAQNTKIDSLKTALAALKTCPSPCAADTARARLMIRLSKQFLKVAEYDSALRLIGRTRDLEFSAEEKSE